MKRLQIIDSTTITLFSNLLFKGVGRHPKTGKKKGGIKVHTVIHSNEGVPSDIKFTSAATNDSFMLRPSVLNKGDIIAMDRAYIDYEKLETLTQREVMYVTKMKKNLRYNIIGDCMYQTKEGLMEVRIQNVTFSKMLKDGTILVHHARIITYVDIKKHKLVSLLTNDMESEPNEIIEIYRKRWEIELLFQADKTEFSLEILFLSPQTQGMVFLFSRMFLHPKFIHRFYCKHRQKSLSLRFCFSFSDFYIICIMFN